MTTLIEVSEATVMRSGRKLFDRFNLKMYAGEHWVIQGANGSGKTALLQLLAGALHPMTGRVNHSFLRETDWEQRYRERREKLHLIPAHSLKSLVGVAEELFYQQRYYSVEESRLPVVRDVFGEDAPKLEALPLSPSFDIQALLNLPVTRLSNGQLKKVIILRQLAGNIPEVLLLDYPFDGLDAESRRDFMRFLDDLAFNMNIHLVLVDHSDILPKAINRRLVLRDFTIDKIESLEKNENGPSHVAPAAPAGHSSGQGKPPVVVEMRDVTIQYGGRKIISNLNWQIRKGERWALTGRNGSGKTTLFSLIYADHPMAYSQEIFLFGRRRGTGESIWDIKRRINYFGPEQIHFLLPSAFLLTGRQWIHASRKNHPQLESLITFFHLSDWIDHPIRSLSSGQVQLLMLVNLFLDDRELLLLDEPFQFLDPFNHGRVTDYMNHYLNKDTTLILITHDEADVIRWTQLRKQI